MLTNILLVIHTLSAVSMVILILLQQGKGADMGAAFGGGSSQSVFGSRGSANFLSRTTAILVAVFFTTSLSLAYLYSKQSVRQSVISTTPVSTPVEQQEAGKDAVESGKQDNTPTSESSKAKDDIPSVPRQSGAPVESDVPEAPK